jgi:hypothetical protein
LWHLGEECPVADALGRIRESKLGNNSPRQNLQALISTFFLNQKKIYKINCGGRWRHQVSAIIIHSEQRQQKKLMIHSF